MISKDLRVKIRLLHRWAGVILGIQVALWVISGAYFAWLSIDFIKGKETANSFAESSFEQGSITPLSSLALPPNFPLTSVQVESTPRGILYHLQGSDKSALYFDGHTAQKLTMITPENIRDLAFMQEQEAPISEINLVDHPLPEYKGQLPIYQIKLHDGKMTNLYADPWTGRILARRNVYWSIYDFLWMLHIMDYKSREDFNNVWVRILSLGAIGILASGYLLFFVGKMPARSKM